MSQYLINSTTLEAIGDEIRTMSGTTNAMSTATMTNKLVSANSEIDTQTGLIVQILNSLPETDTSQFPELSNPAEAEQILSGYDAINERGEHITGTHVPSANPVLIKHAKYTHIWANSSINITLPNHKSNSVYILSLSQYESDEKDRVEEGKIVNGVYTPLSYRYAYGVSTGSMINGVTINNNTMSFSFKESEYYDYALIQVC